MARGWWLVAPATDQPPSHRWPATEPPATTKKNVFWEGGGGVRNPEVLKLLRTVPFIFVLRNGKKMEHFTYTRAKVCAYVCVCTCVRTSRDYYLHNARRIMEIIVFSILRNYRNQDYYLQYVHIPSKLDQNLRNAHILKMKKQTNSVSEGIQEKYESKIHNPPFNTLSCFMFFITICSYSILRVLSEIFVKVSSTKVNTYS